MEIPIQEGERDMMYVFILVLLFLVVLPIQSLRCKSLFNRNILSTILASSFAFVPLSSFAVSGGGVDYATANIRSFNFNKQQLINKDFTQCDAVGATFVEANLKGSRFYRANLKNADFSKANLNGVSLEDTDLSDALFKDAVLTNSYLSGSIIDAKVLTNVDFSDSIINPPQTVQRLCGRSDVTGTNPVTGVDTRESLLCSD